MTQLIENTIMFNTIAATFKVSDKDKVDKFVVTADRSKQIADSADQYIIKRDCDKVEP